MRFANKEIIAVLIIEGYYITTCKINGSDTILIAKCAESRFDVSFLKQSILHET